MKLKKVEGILPEQLHHLAGCMGTFLVLLVVDQSIAWLVLLEGMHRLDTEDNCLLHVKLATK